MLGSGYVLEQEVDGLLRTAFDLRLALFGSYGFRTYRAIKVMLYPKLGAPPELNNVPVAVRR